MLDRRAGPALNQRPLQGDCARREVTQMGGHLAPGESWLLRDEPYQRRASQMLRSFREIGFVVAQIKKLQRQEGRANQILCVQVRQQGWSTGLIRQLSCA